MLDPLTEYYKRRDKCGPLKLGAIVVTQMGAYGKVVKIHHNALTPYDREVDLTLADGNHGWCHIGELEEWTQP